MRGASLIQYRDPFFCPFFGLDIIKVMYFFSGICQASLCSILKKYQAVRHIVLPFSISGWLTGPFDLSCEYERVIDEILYMGRYVPQCNKWHNSEYNTCFIHVS